MVKRARTFYPRAGQEVKVASTFNHVCCDCGSAHKVRVKIYYGRKAKDDRVSLRFWIAKALTRKNRKVSVRLMDALIKKYCKR